MDPREATARRTKAAQALGGFTNAEGLADATKELGNVGLKRIREIQQKRGDAPRAFELRTIAEACDLPYEFFTADFRVLTEGSRHYASAEDVAKLQDELQELVEHLQRQDEAIDATREAMTATRQVTQSLKDRAVAGPSESEAAGGTHDEEDATQESDRPRREASQ